MPVQLLWNNQQQSSLRIVFPASAQECDWYTAVSQLSIMLNQVKHPVNVILDMSELKQLPFDIIASINASKKRYHKNHGAQVVVLKSSLHRPMNALLRDTSIMTGTKIVGSLNEADQAFRQLMPLGKIG